MLRWSLILVFMMLKAGLIVAVFMHMAWERLALVYAILVPPLLVLVLRGMMVVRSRLHAADAADLLRPAISAVRPVAGLRRAAYSGAVKSPAGRWARRQLPSSRRAGPVEAAMTLR